LAGWTGTTSGQAAQVVQIDLDDRMFLQWHDSPVQMGWAAPRAFIVLTLLQYGPDQIPADVGRQNFLRHGMATEIVQILDQVAAADPLWELLGGRPGDFAARVDALRGRRLGSVTRRFTASPRVLEDVARHLSGISCPLSAGGKARMISGNR
jgi:hypothetical protein